MNALSTPVLSADLPAYVAALAARIDRLEQQNRSQRPRQHMHPLAHNASEYDDCYNPHHYFGLSTGQHSHSVSKAA